MLNRFVRRLEDLVHALKQHLSEKNFLLVSSVLVGFSAALAAVVLKLLVFRLHDLLTRNYQVDHQYYYYLVFPGLGILLAVWLEKRFFKGVLSKGTAQVVSAVMRKGGSLGPEHMYAHVFTSAVTVAFGGSAGLEAPIVVTGSAIGSNYSRRYRLSPKARNLLLASGAAAGVAASFNAPVAGLLFALEVLLADVTIAAFIPLILAAAVGALLSKLVLGSEILLNFHLQSDFAARHVPFYLLLGAGCGLVSVYYARIFVAIEGWIRPTPRSSYRRAVFGGLWLALLILLFPPLFGEGFETIRALAEGRADKLFAVGVFGPYLKNGSWVLLALALTMFMKAAAAAITLGSGGNGGNFAPSLMVGALLGYTASALFEISGIAHLPSITFMVVGMAGVLSGVFRAPLTGIFLIAELTGGYELMIPLMLVSALSYTVARYLAPLSMDDKKLEESGVANLHDRDAVILSGLRTYQFIETDFVPVSPGATLGQIVQAVASSHRNVFPVVNERGILVGMVSLDDLRDVMFKQHLYSSVYASTLMRKPYAVVSPNEEVEVVMRKFEDTGSWNLPVVEDGVYKGFVSKSTLLNRYRDQLRLES